MDTKYNPLADPPPAEVPLPNSPLVRVIAQVRFPLIVSIEKRDFIAPFQEAIRGSYPVLRTEQTQGLVVGPQVLAPIQPQITWRFLNDAKGDWRVSLAPEFLALETTGYVSRSDFFGRLETVVKALEDHIDPKILDRLGVRYIDRVTGDAMNRIRDLARPEVLGVLATSIRNNTLQSLSESLFEVPGKKAQLMARWGILPKGVTMDASAMETIEQPSWILDIDMFSAESKSFDARNIIKEARDYAERIYALFRWAVTPDFLKFYGGHL